MKRKKQRRLLVVAEWLRSTDREWWFFSAVLKLNRSDTEPVLLGNGRLYNEKDRKSLPGHALYVLKTVLFAARLCFICRKKDVLFCWNQLIALLPATAFRMSGAKRVVVCQNFLYRSSASAAADVFRRAFYNYALGYQGLYLSLQSNELLGHYKNLGLTLSPERCYAVKDCLPQNRVPQRFLKTPPPDTESGGYVFTGGEANRDWKTVMDIARQLPGQPFKVVARKRFFDPQLPIPPNVTIHWDTSLEEYFSLLAGSKMALIAVKDNLNPAGLLLLFDAVVLGKPVVATQTPFITPYLGTGKDELGFTTAEEAAAKIERLQNTAVAERVNGVLQNSLAEADPETFVTLHLNQIYKLRVAN